MVHRHLVLGAGPVGRATAALLAERGDDVALASRSGTGPDVPGVRRVAVDATDAAALSALADGVDVLYNCLNPADYTAWTRDWPPMAAAVLAAAESSGALLVITGNLYPYGQVDQPMVEGMPDAATDPKGVLRAQMWDEALAGHEAGRLRSVEVRGSDYVGPGVGENGHVTRQVPALLAGKGVRVLGSPDQPHSWTDVRDMARALVAVADRPEAWGRVWHAPTNPPRTQREALADVSRAAGREPVRVRSYPRLVVDALAPVVPMLRELRGTRWQFERPYLLDSSAITRELGLGPTPWDDVCLATAEGNAASLSGQAASGAAAPRTV